MIMSPGAAASMAAGIVLAEGSTVGFFPPTVTVTVSIDTFPLAVVMMSSPQRAGLVPGGTFSCWIEQVDADDGMDGTVPVIVASLHETLVMAIPPIVTLGQLPVAGHADGRAPKP